MKGAVAGTIHSFHMDCMHVIKMKNMILYISSLLFPHLYRMELFPVMYTSVEDTAKT